MFDQTTFDSVRSELLLEAQSSPNLLSDLAGLEKYVAESYSSRAFVELLQNADDAGASRVLFQVAGDSVICANNGREFSAEDFQSLCRSASSSKRRGDTIGYRGIGFKSVAGIATEIHLLSGGLQTTFSKKLTRTALGVDHDVPLIRVPHSLMFGNHEELRRMMEPLTEQGFTTVFVFRGLDMDQVHDEFDRFDAEYLLFLNSVSTVTLRAEAESTLTREELAGTGLNVRLISQHSEETWRIDEENGVALAYMVNAGAPVPLRADQSIVHAYLPTLETSGIGVRVNGDFSTDPSRTRIVTDAETIGNIDVLVNLVASRLGQLVPDRIDDPVVRCLLPNVDTSMLELQKRSFRSEFLTRLIARLKGFGGQLQIAPRWLNSNDCLRLDNEESPVRTVSQAEGDAKALLLARLSGANRLSSKEVLEAAVRGRISLQGIAELVGHLASSPSMLGELSLRDVVLSPVWPGQDGQQRTLEDSLVKTGALEPAFVSLLESCGVTLTGLGESVRSMVEDPTREIISTWNLDTVQHTSLIDDAGPNGPTLPPVLPTERGDIHAGPIIVTTTNSTNWRSGELAVLELLRGIGYQAEDHSRRNLGYDILAIKDELELFVEVKTLGYAGAPFALTPNEESTARQYGENYAMALILRNREQTFVNVIRNPLGQLDFNKQCRQWVWECSEYEFQANYVLDDSPPE